MISFDQKREKKNPKIIYNFLGTPLPQNMFQMATVTNPANNGLIIVGGYSKVIKKFMIFGKYYKPGLEVDLV